MPNNFKPAMGRGDTGFTDLLGGRRVSKKDRRVKLNALIDELSCVLGLAKTGLKNPALRAGLTAAQKDLVFVSGVIAGSKADLGPAAAALYRRVEAAAAGLKPLKKFVVPGKNKPEALLHLARAKARLCELLAWEIKTPAPAAYLNRLSDYLFLAALKSARK
ncbi:MAG TPA: ATP:cob(I)alamin adenosyltransferase [Elusimicrobiales bacterium]|nr:ATP:cob(I)alamin adenosyltransferase [Elusimicrobiales bacterium]